ncbi:MAG TPA: hypothetical protein VFY40_15340 [Blastocatellia bacterium]|nr:hypothetical protein [Blastocatellia bacterium]
MVRASPLDLVSSAFTEGREELDWFWRNFSREESLSLFSASHYAASAASDTCRIMAPGPVISDVSNCLLLILFANSIPLNVTLAFPNVLYLFSDV